MSRHTNRLYQFIGANGSTVGSGHATYDSIMLSKALSDAEKSLFDTWAADAQHGDRRWINDIEFVVRMDYRKDRQ